eukprot:c13910_g1_i1.p1 GENE.c13910_g1_i1~~c13910_g1_i1.p1  ORF type:complete len:219 (-),score=76.57 c13910_g1_i1:19-675(-)
MEGKKIKILCLHGFGMNAKSMEMLLDPVVQRNKSFVDFYFIDGAHHEKHSKEVRLWWQAIPDKNQTQPKQQFNLEGLEKSVEVVEKFDKEHGPFDGVIGFSQGAALAAIIIAYASVGRTPIKFKFALFVGGYLPNSQNLSEWRDSEKILFNVPSIHVYGKEDTIIVWKTSEKFSRMYSNPIVNFHPLGHIFPLASDDLKLYETFFKSQYQLITSPSKL